MSVTKEGGREEQRQTMPACLHYRQHVFSREAVAAAAATATTAALIAIKLCKTLRYNSTIFGNCRQKMAQCHASSAPTKPQTKLKATGN